MYKINGFYEDYPSLVAKHLLNSKRSRKLDCMDGCHNGTVTNHHDFEEMGVDNCFVCHEKGVPRGR